MSKEDPPPSPGHGLFDPTNHLLGPPPTSMAGGLPFPSLAHLPSAFSLLGRQPMFAPSLFGGLGALSSPLLNPAFNPAAAAYLAGVQKHFVESLSPPPSSLKSSSKSAPSPTSQKRSSSSSSKRVTSSPCSTASSSASSHQVNGRSPTPTSATVSSKSTISSGEGSRKRKQKVPKAVAVPISSSVTKSSPLSIPSYPKIKSTFNSSKIPNQIPKKEQKVDNGMLSDSDSHSLVSSGSSISDDSYADNITSDDERQRRKKLKVGEDDDNKYQITPHQIDGLKKQLLADQIRQRVQNKNNSEISPQQSPKNKERKPKNPKFLSQIENEDQLSQQEELKHQLEVELKQQKNRLRLLMKEAENQKSQDNTSTDTSNVTKSVPPLKLKIPNLKFKLQPEANGSDLGEGTSKPQLNDLDKVGTTSDSDTDSDDSGSSDNDSSNDSDRDQSQGSQNDSRDNGEHGEKHSLDSESMDEAGTRKKRRLVTDESELRIPLEHSWLRQTTIHTMGRRGIVGEVLYFAPCGKKMRTIPDVIRYLDRHNITDLTRDNFTFNTKVNVGEFFELLQGQTSPVKLSEIEVMERIEMSRGKRARMQANARKKRERCMKQQALAKQLMELNMKRKLEQEELSQKAAEIKFQKRLERQRQKIQQRRQQQLKLVIERQKQQEQLKHAKQQEKVRKQEQLRMEREMKAQQILEVCLPA
ncbi:bromodomain adjacent to zinc finger domain protein 2B [Patella vulgata]|uniref:bromodomain adjacent to zinc finger domain protein 2B n=1 Tax=Patella vulgata TaxID=6465 RepID=UPI0024A7FBEF|nr:bromodomain adjacent to zinc finger domain protein 2B [Patella vulgata]